MQYDGDRAEQSTSGGSARMGFVKRSQEFDTQVKEKEDAAKKQKKMVNPSPQLAGLRVLTGRVGKVK